MEQLNMREVGEVARLASQRHAFMFGRSTSSNDVGIALGLNTDEIERLLQEVRCHRQAGVSTKVSQAIKMSLGALSALFLVVCVGKYALNSLGSKEAARKLPKTSLASLPYMPALSSLLAEDTSPSEETYASQPAPAAPTSPVSSVPFAPGVTSTNGLPPRNAEFLTGETGRRRALEIGEKVSVSSVQQATAH